MRNKSIYNGILVILLMILVLLNSVQTIGQNLLTAKYNFSGENYLFRIEKQSSDTSYIVSGSNYGIGLTALPFLLKTDKNFNPSWMKIYELMDTLSSNQINFYPLVRFNYSEDSLFICGNTTIYDSVGHSVASKPFVCKLNKNGELLFAKLINITLWDVIIDALPTPDGGLLIAGSTKYFKFGIDYDKGNFFAIKLDAQLNQQWAKLYGDTLRSGSGALTILPDSGFVLSGYTWEFNYEDGNWVIMRLDKNGNVVWCKRTAPLYESYAISRSKMILGLDSQLVIAYEASSFFTGYVDISLAKVDLNGNLLWHKSIGTNVSAGTNLNDMLQLSDSNFIIQGGEFILVSNSGNILNVKGLNMGFIKTASAIANSFEDKIVGVGDYRGISNLSSEMYLFTMDSIGNTACGNINFTSYSTSIPMTLTDWTIPDSSVTFYETALTYTQYDSLPVFQHLCYLNDGLKNAQEVTLTLFPNPSQNNVSLKCSKEMVKFELSNLHGQVLIKMEANKKEVQLSIADLDAGIYLLKIYLKDELLIKKLVKQN